MSNKTSVFIKENVKTYPTLLLSALSSAAISAARRFTHRRDQKERATSRAPWHGRGRITSHRLNIVTPPTP